MYGKHLKHVMRYRQDMN